MEEQIDRTVRELEQQIFAAGEIIVQQDDPARPFGLPFCLCSQAFLSHPTRHSDCRGLRGLESLLVGLSDMSEASAGGAKGREGASNVGQVRVRVARRGLSW